MPRYNLRSHLSNGPLFATSILTGARSTVEALAESPFDALCFDMEHTTLNASEVEQLIITADAHSVPSIVRVPTLGPDIGRVLDAGASGLILPQVETAAQAEEFVARGRYAPLGRRGIGPGRGASYGADLAAPDYAAQANARTFLAIQIESVAGVAAADEILSTPGIDAVVIGPGDLASSLGVAPGAPEVWTAVERVFDAARVHGVVPGAFCFRDPEVDEFLARGARFLLIGADLNWTIRGAFTQWASLQESLANVTVGATR